MGDQVLKEISRSFQDYLREYDLAGRFGGEEFVLLLPHTAERDAYRIAERMRAHIAGMPIGIGGGTRAEPVHVTVSIGVAVLDETRRDLDRSARLRRRGAVPRQAGRPRPGADGHEQQDRARHRPVAVTCRLSQAETTPG